MERVANKMGDALRMLVREVLRDPRTAISEETAFAVGEFLAANEPLDLELHMYALKPYVKVYTGLYRVWMHHESDAPVEELEAEAKRRPYLSSTRAVEAIPRMLDELGSNEDVAITKFDGEGFDPYEVLNNALEQHPDHPEYAYLRSALKAYAYQKEIVVLRIISPQKKMNIS